MTFCDAERPPPTPPTRAEPPRGAVLVCVLVCDDASEKAMAEPHRTARRRGSGGYDTIYQKAE